MHEIYEKYKNFRRIHLTLKKMSFSLGIVLIISLSYLNYILVKDYNDMQNGRKVVMATSNFGKKAYAFYFPWIGSDGNHWDDPTKIYQGDHPARLNYDIQNNLDDVRYAVQTAKSAELDGFVVWWVGPPPGSPNGEYWPGAHKGWDLLQQAADETGSFEIVPWIDVRTFNSVHNLSQPPDPNYIKEGLIYIYNHYSSHPSYPHINNKPVLWVYSGTTGDLSEWNVWRSVLDELKGQGVDFFYLSSVVNTSSADSNTQLSVSGGIYADNTGDWGTYDEPGKWTSGVCTTFSSYAHTYPEPRLWVADIVPNISGESNDIKETRKFHQGARTLYNEGDWFRWLGDLALSSEPDWLIFNSWNNWHPDEKTYIEPSQNYGNTYLDLTKEYISKFKPSGTVSPAPPPATATPVSGSGSSTVSTVQRGSNTNNSQTSQHDSSGPAVEQGKSASLAAKIADSIAKTPSKLIKRVEGMSRKQQLIILIVLLIILFFEMIVINRFTHVFGWLMKIFRKLIKIDKEN